MKINPTTMLFEELNDFQAEVLFDLANEMMNDNGNSNHNYYKKWLDECNMTREYSRQVFPMRALHSVATHFMKEYKELEKEMEDHAMERNMY